VKASRCYADAAEPAVTCLSRLAAVRLSHTAQYLCAQQHFATDGVLDKALAKAAAAH
jgi:hypothetical protein